MYNLTDNLTWPIDQQHVGRNTIVLILVFLFVIAVFAFNYLFYFLEVRNCSWHVLQDIVLLALITYFYKKMCLNIM